ncbi:MAG: SUMF1/EgtB/PvdO family nonheme iron enzyme [Methylococcales bacterium]|nr:SUMF1/EgtB/PvdO family nonheme iron enzyme [Methylococcales bacterium]
MNYTLNALCPNCFKVSRQKQCQSCNFDRTSYREEEQHLPLFSIIGEHYTLGRVLSSSELALVYRAKRDNENELFVIKEYYPEQLAGRARDGNNIKPKNGIKNKQAFDFYHKQFINESHLLENCQKYPAIEGIVRYADLIEQNNTLYLVMEYIKGCTLFDLWLNQQKLSEKQIKLWLKPLLDTLEKLHQRNYYHQNISLKNIFLRDGDDKINQPVLMDFGLSLQTIQPSVTNLNAIKYKAPEQHIDNPETHIDALTDLYSLGAVLFHCINGKEMPNIEIRRMGSALVFIKNVDPTLKKTIERCLALSKKNRLQTVAALKKLLIPFFSSSNQIFPNASLEEQRKRDSALWQQTKKAENIKAYQSYLDHCELGEQAEIAVEAIKRLKLEARLIALENQNGVSPSIKIIEHFSLSTSQDKLIDGQLAPVMVLIPEGRFLMGSAETEIDRFENETQHDAVIEKPFHIGKYPVTFSEYDLFCEQTSLTHSPKEKPDDSGWGRGARPVIHVSWFDAMAYCEWLSEQTGKNYKLPTEIEWEYACRAKSETAYYFGPATKELKDYAWYRKNAEAKTHEVGLKQPNFWGIYDMHGNVWEWTSSKYHESYSLDEMQLADNLFFHPVVRGGSWDYIPWWLRSAYRDGWEASYRNSDLGFRVIRTC